MLTRGLGGGGKLWLDYCRLLISEVHSIQSPLRQSSRNETKKKQKQRKIYCILDGIHKCTSNLANSDGIKDEAFTSRWGEKMVKNWNHPPWKIDNSSTFLCTSDKHPEYKRCFISKHLLYYFDNKSSKKIGFVLARMIALHSVLK